MKSLQQYFYYKEKFRLEKEQMEREKFAEELKQQNEEDKEKRMEAWGKKQKFKEGDRCRVVIVEPDLGNWSWLDDVRKKYRGRIGLVKNVEFYGPQDWEQIEYSPYSYRIWFPGRKKGDTISMLEEWLLRVKKGDKSIFVKKERQTLKVKKEDIPFFFSVDKFYLNKLRLAQKILRDTDGLHKTDINKYNVEIARGITKLTQVIDEVSIQLLDEVEEGDR